MADINLNLKVDAGKGVATLNGIEVALKKIDKAAEDSGSSFGKIQDIFLGAFGAGIALKGVEALASGLSKLTGFVEHSIAESSQYEQSLQNLNVALAASGNFSKEASNSFAKFADEIERTTVFTDDAVISAGALISSLTQLSGDALQQATKAAIDFAAATGKDLDTAAQAVSKSINGQTEAFGRYGISIQKGATDAENLKNTLDALNARFGGAAAAQVNTFSGAVALTSNAFKSLQQEVGAIFTRNVALVNVVKALGVEFGNLSKFVVENQQNLREFIASGIIFLIDASASAIIALDGIVRSLTVLGNIAQILDKTLVVFADTVVTGFLEITRVISNLIPGMGDLSTATTNALTKVRAEIKATNDAAVVDFQEIDNAIKNPTNTANTLTDALIRLREEAVAGQAIVDAGGLTESNPTNNLDQVAADEQEKTNILLNANLERIELLRQQDEGANAQQIADLQAKNDVLLAKQRDFGDKATNQTLQTLNKQKQLELKISQERLQAASTFFSGLTALAKTAGKEGFEIAKQTATAQAIIDGIRAVQAALANPPGPPFNALIVAGIAAQTAANVINIQRQQFKHGTDFVPGIGRGDKVPALLEPGERVVPRETNRDLTQFLREGKSSGVNDEVIMEAIDAISSRPVVVQIDGREVFVAVNDQIRSGREFVT